MSQTTILIVDDEQQILKYFARFFGRSHQVLTAENLADAKTILNDQNAQIQLLITDHRLPDGRGIELLQEVRTNYPHIGRFLSTGIDSQDIKDARDVGDIQKCILKPWDLIELQNDINAFFLEKSA